MYDTIIIGAGMSGLAAGIRLAHYDQRVCILERHTTIGGLNSFYRLGGRNFDVGLHAVTNYTPRGARKGPLARLLKQLRIGWEEFALAPQAGSRVAFPGVSLNFTNDFDLFCSEVERAFPAQKDNFQRLIAELIDYDDLETAPAGQSARERVSGIITDPLLVEMLFCPVMYYGSAREHDMDFGQFCIMFRSIFMEGLARPHAGVRVLLKKLVRRFKEFGGELRLRSGVQKIVTSDGEATRIVLDNGEELEAKNVLSSAGWLETMRMCDDVSTVEAKPAGQLAFVETLSVLDCKPRDLGCETTIIFYNDSEKFHWEKPDELLDPRCGVICSPNNFLYDQPLSEGLIRVTMLANYDRWNGLDENAYRLEKLRGYEAVAESAVRFIPEFRHAVIDIDMFTPTTVRRFTGHDNGAIYGAPEKHPDGRTHLKNLYVCGTDQGLVGIVGAIMSGIGVANRYLLR